jgi:hypothetical protein
MFNIIGKVKTMEEIVHVIPLGHEIDRAVKPFEKLKGKQGLPARCLGQPEILKANA